MYDVDFMSLFDYCTKYGINPIVSPIRAMVYNQVKRKICIVDLRGKSESQIYWGLCHELLHAVLHEVIGEEVCIALDNVTEFNERTPDGKNAFIWIGDDPEEAGI